MEKASKCARCNRPRPGRPGPWLLLLMMLLPSAAARAQSEPAATPPPGPTTAPDALTTAQKIELDIPTQWLRDPALGADKRKQAALLLINKMAETAQPAVAQAAEAALIETLTDKNNAGGRLAVVEALAATLARNGHQISEAFLDPLIGALGDSNEAIRKAAARALAGFRDRPGVLDRLRKLILDADKPIDQRTGAILAFAWMPPSRQTVETLITVLDDPDPALQKQALAAVNNLTLAKLDDAEAARQWWNRNKDKSPLDWVLAVNEQLNQELYELRQQCNNWEGRLVSALRELYQATPTAQKQSELLAKYIADPLPAVRVLGLSLVDRMIGDSQKVPAPIQKAVADHLADPSAQVRAAAADVIAYLDEPKADQLLIKQLSVESDPHAKVMMIKALGRLKSADAVGLLLKLLNESPDRPVVAEAAAALGAIGGTNGANAEPTVSALLERYRKLSPDQTELRDALVNAMADISHPKFLPVMLASLTEPSAALRQAAARGLGLLVGQLSDAQKAEAVEALVTRLASETDLGVRLALITALGKFPPTRPQLEAIYGRTNPAAEQDESVRKRAWDTLVALLKSADPQVQLAWARQMEISSEPTILPRLIDLLQAVQPTARPEDWTATSQSLVEMLADALMRANRATEAAPRYERLYNTLRDANSGRTGELALKLMQSLTASNQPAPAVQLLKQRIDATGKPDAGGLIDPVLGRVRSLLEPPSPNPGQAVLWIGEIRQQLPELSQSAPWARTLKELADQTQKLYAEQMPETVRKSLDQITGSDPAAAAAARKRIEQFGPVAVPVLLDELSSAVDAGDKGTARETAIVALLSAQPLEVKDYDFAAPVEKKKQLIAGYRQRYQLTTRPSQP